MSQVSLLDIDKIKREARKVKKQYPTLSHGQRLDKVSIEMLKVRNYHEAKKLSKKHVNSFVHYSGTTGKCSYCHLLFVTTEKDEVQEHEIRHLEYEKVEHTLGFVPAGMDSREKEKRLAYKELATKDSDVNQIKGALRLMNAFFEKSLESSIANGYWSMHPTFEKYIAMLDLSHIFTNKIMETIRERYGKIDGVIEKGRTHWAM